MARVTTFGDNTREPTRGVTLVRRIQIRRRVQQRAAATLPTPHPADNGEKTHRVLCKLLNGQVSSGSMFDTVLFIQSIQERLARREKANKKP